MSLPIGLPPMWDIQHCINLVPKKNSTQAHAWAVQSKEDPNKSDVNLLSQSKFLKEVKGNELFSLLVEKELNGGIPVTK